MKDVDNIGYKSWDEISPEQQKILKELYSQEELDMMFSPRRWVMVPNVVGMKEADAYRTLKNLGFVVRVYYGEYNGISDIKEGCCYNQVADAGRTWNTDAAMGIAIYKINKTPTPTIEITSIPIPEVTPAPTEEPTPELTSAPIEEPTPEVTSTPTEEPTPEVTPAPTEEPTQEITPIPTEEPTPEITLVPTEEPTPAES